jgi:hypothetical protein
MPVAAPPRVSPTAGMGGCPVRITRSPKWTFSSAGELLVLAHKQPPRAPDQPDDHPRDGQDDEGPGADPGPPFEACGPPRGVASPGGCVPTTRFSTLLRTHWRETYVPAVTRAMRRSVRRSVPDRPGRGRIVRAAARAGDGPVHYGPRMAESADRSGDRARHDEGSAAPFRLWAGAGLIALGLIVAGCGQGSAARSDAPATTASANAGDDPAAFCDLVAAHADTPEAFVGSPEHVADLGRLAAVAPAAVLAQVEAVRAYVSSGAVDPTKPDSQNIANWPTAVQSATADLSSYTASTCGVHVPG